jgi:hypothetical protein
MPLGKTVNRTFADPIPKLVRNLNIRVPFVQQIDHRFNKTKILNFVMNSFSSPAFLESA